MNQDQINEHGELRQSSPQIQDTRKGKYGEWILQGYTPKSNVPIWRYDWDRIERVSKYSGAKLRELRKERGIGKRKVLTPQ